MKGLIGCAVCFLSLTLPSALTFEQAPSASAPITIFLCGDVMTGRGIDQILPFPSDSTLHEPYVKNAMDYVRLAEKKNGAIKKPVSFPYIWGDALKELDRVRPDLKIINLETSVTTNNDFREDKEIHYRMNPRNIPCLTAAGIDCCSLANNHVLDWGEKGLLETLDSLRKASIATAGVGRNIREAGSPAIMEISGKGRVIVLSCGSVTSGIPRDWAAYEKGAGVNLLRDLSERTVQEIGERVRKVKRKGDIVVLSIHWGGNWGYEIYPDERAFCHGLIDKAGVDIIHGHSSHHVKGMEIYKGKPIIYGCGDFLNDYEGITGYEGFRADLTLMYFPTMDPVTGRLLRMEMVPLQIRRFSLRRTSEADSRWLTVLLDREGKGTSAEMEGGSIS
ncbi:MAG: CapA family protein, partial [Nitrospirales bacterium]|nr:CapA family protein [Nitrospirales bacterium]